ncbi:MAG: Fe-S cluster assembly protein SufD [Planctomycetes bacterium]|nr:Fe-S cluster assembly protein SufD [Planctomycetota bacterium]
MTTALQPFGFDTDSFEAFLAQRAEPDWLLSMRRQSWDTYSKLAWPTRDHEEWIRTDIRTFRIENFRPPIQAPPASVAPPGLLTREVELAGACVSINSHSTSHWLAPQLASKGVLFGSLPELLADNADRLRPHLERQIVLPGYDKFAALTSAFWIGGQLLFVPRGVRVELPLHSLAALTADGVDLQKTLVILEEGAEATMLSETASLSVDVEAGNVVGSAPAESRGLHAGITEIVQGAGSRLRYVNLQNWGTGVWHFAHQKARLERDAGLQWTLAALGGKTAKVNQQVELAGKRSECQVNGVMFTEGRQHFSYHTLQHHQAPETRSDFLYKSALQDKSRTVWRGMIKVDPAAQKTDGYQRNDNLLLSDTSRADSIPGLEIEADDVRCTHGSTSGNVEEELIFYACSRGLTRREAVRLIVTGFFQQVLDRITIPSVRDALVNAIAQRVREYR